MTGFKPDSEFKCVTSLQIGLRPACTSVLLFLLLPLLLAVVFIRIRQPWGWQGPWSRLQRADKGVAMKLGIPVAAVKSLTKIFKQT